MDWKYRGMAIGAAFMIFFGGVWLAVPLQYEMPSAPWLFVLAISAMLLVVGCVDLFRMASRMPADSGESDQDYFATRRKIRKTFGIVFGAEIILIALAANLLPAIGLEPLAVPVIAIIVGLHFIPLAGLFKSPIYYVTGALSVVIGLGSLLVKVDIARQDLVGFSMCAVLWLTALAVLGYARKDWKQLANG